MGIVREAGGKIHAKQYLCLRPTANKYHEGKVKRTLKRELKVPEIAGREANETSPLSEIVVRHGDGSSLQRKRGGGF